MKNSCLTFSALILMSCSHVKEAPKTVHFPYASELLEKVQTRDKRTPASFADEDLSEKSPRRVYFSALYHQYLTLAGHLGKKSAIEFCPQFHHDKVETDAGLVPKVSLHHATDVESPGKEYFPELAFSKDFSLKDYHLSMKEEIATLCEEGVSDNFYKFDNLITHFAHKPSFHQNPKAMESVLKIPVFANFYLVKMLETPRRFQTSAEEKRFIRMTKTHWFESYVAEASRLRSNFIKNKMVRR